MQSLTRYPYINLKTMVVSSVNKTKLQNLYSSFQHFTMLVILLPNFLHVTLRSSRSLTYFLQDMVELILCAPLYWGLLYVANICTRLETFLDLMDQPLSSMDINIFQKCKRRGKLYSQFFFCLFICGVIVNIFEAFIPLSQEETETLRHLYRSKYPAKRHPIPVYFVLFDETEGWQYVAIFILEVYYFYLLACIGTSLLSIMPLTALQIKGYYEILCQKIMMLGDLEIEESLQEVKNIDPKDNDPTVSTKQTLNATEKKHQIHLLRMTKEINEKRHCTKIIKFHQMLLRFQDELTTLFSPAVALLVIATNSAFSICLYQMVVILDMKAGIRFYEALITFVGIAFQFYFFCESAELFNKCSEDIRRSIINCNWHKCTNQTRRQLILIFRRAQKNNYMAFYSGAIIVNRAYALSVARVGYKFVNFMRLQN
uniref:Odorant receptor n=1 Tax=Diaphorina citri TaxID=121845 RepID=A0A7T3R164_DIACI|nr:odorant receptor 20 [Diaphorina citri]